MHVKLLKMYLLIELLLSYFTCDVNEGGEADYGMILFPKQVNYYFTCWTFPHCGRMPISNNKYIITGWFYKTN